MQSKPKKKKKAKAKKVDFRTRHKRSTGIMINVPISKTMEQSQSVHLLQHSNKIHPTKLKCKDATHKYIITVGILANSFL